MSALPLLWRREAELLRDSGSLVAGAALGALLVGAVAALVPPLQVALPLLPTAVAMAAAALAMRDEPLRRRLCAAVLLAVVAIVGQTGWTGWGLAATPDHLAAWAALAAGGAAAGLVSTLVLLPRHVRLGSMRMRRAHAAAVDAAADDPALLALATAAVQMWQRAEASDEPAGPVRRALEQAALRVLAETRRWATVARGQALPGAAAVLERLRLLALIESDCRDEDARGDLAVARAALEAQRVQVEAVVIGHTRVLARLHGLVATAERLHLAAIAHRSADAATAPTAALLDDLGRLGDDLGAATEATLEGIPR